MNAREIEKFAEDLRSTADWPQWLLDKNKERIAPLYISQELNHMGTGGQAHFETEKMIRYFLSLKDEGFLYLYSDGRIVCVKDGDEILVAYYQA